MQVFTVCGKTPSPAWRQCWTEILDDLAKQVDDTQTFDWSSATLLNPNANMDTIAGNENYDDLVNGLFSSTDFARHWGNQAPRDCVPSFQVTSHRRGMIHRCRKGYVVGRLVSCVICGRAINCLFEMASHSSTTEPRGEDVKVGEHEGAEGGKPSMAQTQPAHKLTKSAAAADLPCPWHTWASTDCCP